MKIYNNIDPKDNNCLILQKTISQLTVRMADEHVLEPGDVIQTFGNVAYIVGEIIENKDAKGLGLFHWPLNKSIYVFKLADTFYNKMEIENYISEHE